MRRRRLLAVVGLIVLVFMSGCSLFGGGEISESELTKEANYTWETGVNASYNVTTEPLLSFSSDEYKAVIAVENQSTVSIHRESLFRGDQPIGIESLQFRFPNETVVNASHQNLTAVEQSGETEIRLPASNGTVGYTAEWGGASGLGSGPRTWRVQTPVEGSHRVIMPDGARTSIPLLSAVNPGGYDSTVEDDRTRLQWEELGSGSITVRYYLARDLFLFAGLFVLALVVGVGGIGYYYRQIRNAREKRQEVGLDVEEEDDDDFGDDGPPPGVR
jgi:hypothetical protein